METKIDSEKMDRFRASLGFWGGVSVPTRGLAGGICLWWMKGVFLDI